MNKFTLFGCLWYFTLGDAINLNSNIRIVGGHDANITDYPYQVSIQYDYLHGCGGSILNENYILTAAHCTYDVREVAVLTVRVGSSYRNIGGTVYTVSKIYQHEDFDETTYNNDIAILLLGSTLKFGDGVQKIALATKGTDIISGLTATASGWGLMRDRGQPAHQLQVVALPSISTEDCQKLYSAGEVTENMFCAGYPEGGKDTCQGDSGGPLVVSGILIGITSWGRTCAEAGSPGAYTKLPLYRDYIDSIINSKK